MEKMSVEQQTFLKKQLADAIANNNREEIIRLSRVLNIPEEQTKYFAQGLTGYPSVDQLWLNKYQPGAYDIATNIPEGKTIWDVIEEKILEYYDIPAIDYFKNVISRPEFRSNVYTWARTFRAMGVEEDEAVPIYGVFFPDIMAMVFALNIIGAKAHFPKLKITEEELKKETADAKIAVVFDDMWPNVANVFSDSRFKNVLVASAADSMPSPKKEIVSFISYFKAKKNKSSVPDEKKYIWLDDAKKIADYYTGEVRVPFKPNRTALITSSSGTSIGGEVKSCEATNESTIAQLLMGEASGIQYYPGNTCLTNFPPTASTATNCLFLLPLYNGMTLLNDPRVSEKDFYNQLMILKPSAAISTGSMWETFFIRLEKEIAAGRIPDLSFAKGWTIGGEGIDKRKLLRWKELMKICGSNIYIGYGCSELFSAISVDTVEFDSNTGSTKEITGVGLPYAGIQVGIYDEKGNELSYNQRGEIRIGGKSIMKGYYKKPHLTEKVLIEGQIHTGDIGEIDENGYLYVWGRKGDKMDIAEDTYLFDIANLVKLNEEVDDSILIPMVKDPGEEIYAIHVSFKSNVTEEQKEKVYREIEDRIQTKTKQKFGTIVFHEVKGMIPYSPTTLKKDRNGLFALRKGFKTFKDGELVDVEFTEKNCKLFLNYDIIKKNNKRIMLHI